MEKSKQQVGTEGRSLGERLEEFPELRRRFEELLAIAENEGGDLVKIDEPSVSTWMRHEPP